MDFTYTPEQDRLRDEIREYFRGLLTPELLSALREESDREGGDTYREFVRQIGSDGWLGVGWPKEYGGHGWGAIEQSIFFEEAMAVEAPLPILALNTVGPAIMEFGTQEQKDRILPAILRGEWHVCIGYSEPDAGTDLAALKTRAVRDGDDWVINGQKIFTTQANIADCVWLACRTDPDAAKHAGITIFLVDLASPGVKIVPMPTLVALTTGTFYEDVRVPQSAVVGEVNGGWQLITTQLNLERSMIVASGSVASTVSEVERWACNAKRPDGSRVIDEPWVQLNLARVRVKLNALRLLNMRIAWSIENNTFNFADASSVKVFGTEFYVEAYHLLMEVTGQYGSLIDGPGSEELDGILERASRRAVLTTFGGGVNEIQRDIIGMAGLGLPRSPR